MDTVQVSLLSSDAKELYQYLVDNLVRDRCKVDISVAQKAILLSLKEQRKEPFNGYEYALIIGNIVVNTNWLSHMNLGVTEVMSLEYYNSNIKGNHKINY